MARLIIVSGRSSSLHLPWYARQEVLHLALQRIRLVDGPWPVPPPLFE